MYTCRDPPQSRTRTRKPRCRAHLPPTQGVSTHKTAAQRAGDAARARCTHAPASDSRCCSAAVSRPSSRIWCGSRALQPSARSRSCSIASASAAMAPCADAVARLVRDARRCWSTAANDCSCSCSSSSVRCWCCGAGRRCTPPAMAASSSPGAGGGRVASMVMARRECSTGWCGHAQQGGGRAGTGAGEQGAGDPRRAGGPPA